MADSPEQVLAWEWRDLTLVGTLHAPTLPGPHPVVLMMQGSGPSDRDGDGYFIPIREAFLSRGIATFAFDKPGCGDSTGDWRHYALEDRTAQALSALEILRAVPAIDPERMGIWGQSQGGWLVQMLGARRPDLAFAIANSGPTINLTDQDLYGCEHSMRLDGYSDAEIAEGVAFVAALHQAAVEGMEYEAVESALLQNARGHAWYGYYQITDPTDWQLTRRLVTEGYEPVEALRRIRSPFLAIYGGQDVLLPAWKCAEETGRGVASTVVVFSGGDHRIRDPETGDFVDGYLDLLGAWAARCVFPPHP